MKQIPRPMFFAGLAFAVVLAAFVTLTLTDSPTVRLATTLVTLVATIVMARLLARIMFAVDDEPAPPPAAFDPLPCPAHLRATRTERGFDYFPPLPNKYGYAEDISVSESSNAEYAGIWLQVAGHDESGGRSKVTANLTAETAWRLAEQLALAVATHYHGDQRPELRDTILSIDLERLETGEVAENV
jgi:hypothetical protein